MGDSLSHLGDLLITTDIQVQKYAAVKVGGN